MANNHELIIIGSGPAGMSAAIYATRARLDTLVIEKEATSGGQIINTYEVDNYLGLPSINGFDLAMKMREHVDRFHVPHIEDTILSIEKDGDMHIVVGKKDRYKSKAIIITTGAHHAKLGIDGEDIFYGKGVSYCATCDGAFYKDKTVAVVGGGDVALEDAIFLSKICKKIYLIHRRDSYRAAGILVDKVMSKSNIIKIDDTILTGITGDSKVEKISIKNIKNDDISELEIDGIFVAIGIVPNTEAFDSISKDDKGYILVDDNYATDISGIYAAGDVIKKQLRQIITAVSDGAIAATNAASYISLYGVRDEIR